MKRSKSIKDRLPQVIFFLYLLLFASILFSFRAISSISTGLILAAGLVYEKRFPPVFLKQRPVLVFFTGCILYYLVSFLSVPYTTNPAANQEQLRLQAGLIFIPLTVIVTARSIQSYFQRLVSSFSILLSVTALYCLLIAMGKFLSGSGGSVFFYHELAASVSGHAVYLSIYTFIALVWQIEQHGIPGIQPFNAWTLAQMTILVVFLVLLSSKLVIVFFCIYLMVFAWQQAGRLYGRRPVYLALSLVMVAASGVIFLKENPVSKRFSEIFQGDITFTNHRAYKPADYINGLEFRMLQWQLVPGILREHKKWIRGMTPGDAQQALDREYRHRNIYTGDPVRKDSGFLGYNTHNQFLESLLRHGIPGLLLFGMTWLGGWMLLKRKKERGYTTIVLLLLLYAWLEALLQTQYGLVLYLFFPLFLFAGTMSTKRKNQPVGIKTTR